MYTKECKLTTFTDNTVSVTNWDNELKSVSLCIVNHDFKDNPTMWVELNMEDLKNLRDMLNDFLK